MHDGGNMSMLPLNKYLVPGLQKLKIVYQPIVNMKIH